MLGIVLLLSLTSCKKSYTIMVKSNNTEWGSVTGSGSYKDGETVTITAIPAEGHSFIRWNDGDAANPRQIVVCGDAEYVAMFSDTTGGEDLTGTIVHDAVIDYEEFNKVCEELARVEVLEHNKKELKLFLENESHKIKNIERSREVR